MQGWKIFVHALSMVVRNWREALRIALLPTALGAVAFVVVGVALPQSHSASGEVAARGPMILAGLISVLIWVLAMAWMLVNWHRFILLSEYPSGWLPPLRRDAIGAYLWRLVQMILMVIVALIPFVVLMVILGGLTGVLQMIWVGLMAYGFYRISPILPAAAVGETLGIRAAWDATRPGAGAIVIIIILSMVVTKLASVIDVLLTGSIPVLGAILSIMLTAALGLLNASILTTIYGYYIDGRPLGDASD
ncbi:hypothetical protein [Roseovarius sp. Pro17]|uniref:hypothetical protein n=1 Tax=Roseovarius sp. Pro17 TaxID=3108175 RepID=UPI002D79C15E|nr:hypothetical protein [Roseovarius sp. Pro17]